MKKIIVAFTFLFCFSCSQVTTNNITGTYTIVNDNFIDSLLIKKDGTYERIIYSSSGKLIYKNISNWQLDDERVLLRKFLFFNEDISVITENKDYSKYEKFLIDSSLPINVINDTIRIDLNSAFNIYYKKN